MNKFKRYLIITLAGTLVFSLAFAATAPLVKQIDAPQNILFVGNSFTYYNNSLHNHVRELMRAGHKEVGSIRSLTISGARLQSHAEGLAAQLESREWDAVILQGNSTEAIEVSDVAGFRAAISSYSKSIAATGADTVLFMTWARSDAPEQTSTISAAYTAIGNETGAFVVPVGLAFEMATSRSGEVDLRTADLRHPTLAGTYLAACTFYGALFGESPVGNPYSAGLDEATARALQTTAWESVTAYYAAGE